METVSVQFALLAAARDGADLQTATDRATAAGHRIVASHTVADSEAAIRAQLEAWIADPQIDVVLVLGGADSDAASKALKPLVGEVLPGFTDLFRWLMFQEAGASAMLSSAEAAQCAGTIVFVLPGAIAAAMDKLILPQFDPKTTPRNLVEKLPRLRTEPGEGVPQVIAQEKTQGGSGLPARLPAIPSGRLRSRTGANVIHREQPTDDPTKPIDLERLETELAAAMPQVEDDLTRPTEIPAESVTDADAYAPAADDDHTDVTLAAPPPPKLVQHPGTIPSLVKSTSKKPAIATPANIPARTAIPDVRRQAGTPATPMPAVTIQPRARKSDPPKTEPAKQEPSKWGGESAKAIEAQRAADAAKAAEARKRALTPRPSDPPKNVSAVVEEAPTNIVHTPQPDDRPTSVMARPTAPEPAKPAAAKPVEPAPKPAETPAKPAAAKPAEPPAKPVAAKPAEPPAKPAPAAAVVAKPPEYEPPTTLLLRQDAAKAKPATNGAHRPSASDLDTAKTVDGATPVPRRPEASTDALDPSELIEETDEPADIRSEPPKDVAPPPAPRRRDPTPPPPPPAPRSHPVTEKVDADLPRGTFNYPVQRRGGSLVLKLLLFAVVIGVGFGAVVLIFREKDETSDTPAAAPPPVATNPTPAPPPPTPPAPTPPPTPAPAPEPDIEMEQPAPPPPVVAAKDPKPTGRTQKTSTPPRTGKTGQPAPNPAKTPEAAPPPPAPAPAAVADDDCDETSCILSKYDRACCAKYKPAATADFKPRVGDVPESLDKSMVRQGVEHMKPRVVSCGEKSGVKGTVKISMTVSPEGAVTSASVADTPDATLGDCVLAAMRSAKFGKTVNGATFTYPFAF